jgi:hypothetical protein
VVLRLPSRLDVSTVDIENPAMSNDRDYEALEASELFCPTCKTSRPVRRHLLLVLPTGNKYEYRCAVCASPVGAKDDSDPTDYKETLRGRRLR